MVGGGWWVVGGGWWVVGGGWWVVGGGWWVVGGGWWVVGGGWWVVGGCWLLVGGWWLLVVGCCLLVFVFVFVVVVVAVVDNLYFLYVPHFKPNRNWPQPNLFGYQFLAGCAPTVFPFLIGSTPTQCWAELQHCEQNSDQCVDSHEKGNMKEQSQGSCLDQNSDI